MLGCNHYRTKRKAPHKNETPRPASRQSAVGRLLEETPVTFKMQPRRIIRSAGHLTRKFSQHRSRGYKNETPYTSTAGGSASLYMPTLVNPGYRLRGLSRCTLAPLATVRQRMFHHGALPCRRKTKRHYHSREAWRLSSPFSDAELWSISEPGADKGIFRAQSPEAEK